ncbi:hypothetical protein BGZ89_004626 [Linnemannia elongata]|nr:hypothetical protein BGZ89_004626 [Linnemannia elongata]
MRPLSGSEPKWDEMQRLPFRMSARTNFESLGCMTCSMTGSSFSGLAMVLSVMRTPIHRSGSYLILLHYRVEFQP